MAFDRTREEERRLFLFISSTSSHSHVFSHLLAVKLCEVLYLVFLIAASSIELFIIGLLFAGFLVTSGDYHLIK